ncbi:MAG: prolyl oligopeptidase family serine peptidase [Armatimonadaceae bacterium]
MMKRHSFLLLCAALSMGVSVIGQTDAGAQENGAPFAYPKTRAVDQKDTYFGVTVEDPYRWLEDENSEETAAWVEAQNKITFGYLEKIPYRKAIQQRLTELINYPRYTAPFRVGDTQFYYKNDGLQNQSVLYSRPIVDYDKKLFGPSSVVIDPNVLSPDGTVRLGAFTVSKDGQYAAYGLSSAGSDWQELHVKNLRTGQVLFDTIEWVKVSGIAWQGNGFYYSRYDAPEPGKERTTKNENHKVYYHKVGTSQADDVLVFEDAAHPQRFHTVSTTEDERFAILNVSDRGSGKKGNALFFREGNKPDAPWQPLIPEITDSQYSVVDNFGAMFLVRTNHKAPNGRVVLIDPKKPGEENWKVILPEQPEPLQSVGTAGGKIMASYLKDVTTRAYVYNEDGKKENEIRLPGPGSAGGFGGRSDDQYIFFTYTSFNYPSTVFMYDLKDKKVTPYREPEIPGFKPGDYEVKQAFYPSKDGTKVPMFIVHKKGIKLNGSNPTLLYGYGGFNVTLDPGFSALRIAWLEQGGIFAQANLRGGGEYGEKWHEGGMRLNKQNVFDDFIAAAEYLINQKYTSPEKLAIQGGSNGGLLVGAVMNQRPELFKAAIPQVGVMDMLRFHKFTIGWNWIPDYGSSENEADFKVLYGYSPLHNIRAGARYPATLITTADHDDRVVPAHSFKYAAMLQSKQSGPNPVLIRIETESGHGASNLTKSIEQTADIYAFLFQQLGVDPKIPEKKEKKK